MNIQSVPQPYHKHTYDHLSTHHIINVIFTYKTVPAVLTTH